MTAKIYFIAEFLFHLCGRLKALAVARSWPNSNTFFPTRVLSCRICRSGSNGTSVIKEIRLKNLTPHVLPLRPFKVVGIDTDRSATYDFLLTFHSNHGPISYHFRDKRKSKIANSPNPYVFCAPLMGVPHRIWYPRAKSEKLEWWRYRAE